MVETLWPHALPVYLFLFTVEIDPPYNLTYTLMNMTKDEAGCNVLVSWQYPIAQQVQIGWITLIYELRYRAISEPSNWKVLWNVWGGRWPIQWKPLALLCGGGIYFLVWIVCTCLFTKTNQYKVILPCMEWWSLSYDEPFCPGWAWPLPGWQWISCQVTRAHWMVWWVWKLCKSYAMTICSQISTQLNTSECLY